MLVSTGIISDEYKILVWGVQASGEGLPFLPHVWT